MMQDLGSIQCHIIVCQLPQMAPELMLHANALKKKNERERERKSEIVCE